MTWFVCLMIRGPPRSTQGRSSAASDVYKRQIERRADLVAHIGEEFAFRSCRSLRSVAGGFDFHEAAWEGERKEQRSEFAVTVAASLASHLAARGVDLGLVSNGVDAADVTHTEPISIEATNRDEARKLVDQRKETSRLRPVEVPVRRGNESLTLIMESLARLEFSHRVALSVMMAQEHSQWPRVETAAFIIPAMSTDLFRDISRLKSSGFSVLVLLLAQRNQATAALSALAGVRIPVLHLVGEADLQNVVV